MAVNNCNSLVLSGVSVVRDVVTGTKNMGCGTVDQPAPTTHFLLRHPSHRYPQAVQEPRPRHDDADFVGAADAAARAGRPGGTPGSRASRSTAMLAGGTMSTWSALRVSWQPWLTALPLSDRSGLQAGISSKRRMRDMKAMKRTNPAGELAGLIRSGS